jgi:S-DNA-T family DNA segregation ATPase FtsK/SpoIIIE
MPVAAKNKTKKVTQPPPQASDIAPISIDRQRQIRLGLGIFFLLCGIYTCFSIISYCFTWKIDQSNLWRYNGVWKFILDKDGTPVANWGGRLGSALADSLVFKGAGIASLAIGIAIAGLGLSLIYGKKILPLLRYLRWLSTVLILIAPVLSYILPHSEFRLGGTLGKNTIEYLNGLIGTLGTGMLLLSTVAFFVFVIFALDIRPFLNRMKQRATNMAASMGPEPVFNTPVAEPAEVQELEKVALAEDNEEEEETIAAEEQEAKLWDMTVTQKEEEDGEELLESTEEEPEEEEENDAEYDAYQEYLAHKELANVDEGEKELGGDPEFSFEVIQQQEKPAVIQHGAHISIASNEPYAPELDLPDYRFPTLDLLEDRATEAISLDKEELEKNKNQILQTLRSFGIEIQRISATVGPTVTLYEIVPAEGVRISKIRNLEDDIALNLAALGIRIIAPIPGRGTIGIEVPNAHKQIVSMRTIISSEKFVNNKMSLPIALGKKIDNENYIVDLATMPHLLMAGATGQGKSVGINAILISLLYKKHPSQLKFVMVDPKKVELSIYRVIEKHFLAKLPNEEEAIITDTKKVINTLNALCIEMDNRYELLKEAGARNIKEYNEKFISRKLNPERGHKYLPFIVLVVDEFADLIMTAGKEVEMPIARLAQLARAIGIHLIIATQRPSVNVITGTIKANFPARIAFKVSAKVDSRTILDAGGAEQLIGRGDMLVSHGSELLRLQCAFVDTPEVEEVVEFIGKQRGYASAFELPEYEGEDGESAKEVDLSNRDKLFEDCARVVVQMQSGSTSNLQRRFNLGYNRAGRIMDQLEAASIVGPAVGSKPREVYFKTEAELDQFLNTLA